VPESLFSRATRYTRSPSLDPHENRLTEITAAVLEHVDGLAQKIAEALLKAACDHASQALAEEGNDASSSAWRSELQRRQTILAAAERLEEPRARIRTQVTTPKGRFIDMEIWLRPKRPADTVEDVVLWLEIKEGTDIHGDQLDVYLEDIAAHAAAQKAVLLVAPRGQSFASSPPLAVAPVDWQTATAVVMVATADRTRTDVERWLLDQYADYLREEGLMDPEALDASLALALMEANEAEEAAAGICEHADAWVAAHWGRRTNQATRGRSTEPAFGLGYWANYEPNRPSETASPTWQGAWFEWGLRNTAELDYVNEEDLRGANVFYAGVTFEAKANPTKTVGNEPWLNARLSGRFLTTWFGNYHRLVRLRYPDELLAQTALETQGQALGEWIVEAFEHLAQNAPPQSPTGVMPDSGLIPG
jgi:hypothetical protein